MTPENTNLPNDRHDLIQQLRNAESQDALQALLVVLFKETLFQSDQQGVGQAIIKNTQVRNKGVYIRQLIFKGYHFSTKLEKNKIVTDQRQLMARIRGYASCVATLYLGFYKHLLDSIATTGKNSGENVLQHIKDVLVATDQTNTLLSKIIDTYLSKNSHDLAETKQGFNLLSRAPLELQVMMVRELFYTEFPQIIREAYKDLTEHELSELTVSFSNRLLKIAPASLKSSQQENVTELLEPSNYQLTR